MIRRVLLLLALLAIAFAAVVIPVYIIRPFAPETPRGLAVAYAVKRASPILTVLTLLACLYLAATLWKNVRWWRKALLVLAVVFACGMAWLARQNHFEWMFNPLPHPGFVTVEQATFVQPADMVIAVTHGGESAAFPIRQMAYHHLTQDIVGGVPIVVTY